MSFIDLATVDVVEEVSENAHMLVEDGGEIVRGNKPSTFGIIELKTMDNVIVIGEKTISLDGITDDSLEYGLHCSEETKQEILSEFKKYDLFCVITTTDYPQRVNIGKVFNDGDDTDDYIIYNAGLIYFAEASEVS